MPEKRKRKNKLKMTDVHADDYALTPHADEDILKAVRAGRLDSLSVLTNISGYAESADCFLRERAQWKKQPLLTVHLNLMEGYCSADQGETAHLVDNKGRFCIGWGKLLLWNYHPIKRKTIKKELKAEIKAQTRLFIEKFGDEAPLRFDGHQHTQMIPLVYEALLEVIEEEGYRTEYIRVTKEPILPFLKNISLWRTYRPINWIKNILLNLYAFRMERKVRVLTGQPPMFLWGVLLSGNMDKNRVEKLLPLMLAQAKRRGRSLEILFHPGVTLPEEIGEELSGEESLKFYLSEGRALEWEALMTVKHDRSLQ